jgi:hypothetical protein
MKWFKNRSSTFYSFLLTAVILVWVSSNLNWGGGRWGHIVKTDGNGYYAYLPAVFIYHDLHFNFIDEIHDDSLNANINKEFVYKINGKAIDKYFAGTALCLIPFFGMGHLVNYVSGLPLDGYTVYYRIFAQIGTLFYALFGLFFLVKTLRFFSTDDKIIALSILAVVFGTNLFHYIVSEPLMSHVYSFGFVNLYVYSLLKFFKSPSRKYFLTGILALALVILIRPINTLVVLSLPFLAQGSGQLKVGTKYLIRHLNVLFAGLLLFLAVISIQLIIYKIQTGHFFVYSYAKEGFNFLHPHMFDFMFSYRKGFFVYTPILFVTVFGFIYLYKDKYRFYTLLFFLIIVIYVLSSWWMWYYGGSFSQRVLIEYYIYFFILFSLLLQKSKFRKFLFPLTFLLIIVCQIQTYQYMKGYIHWSKMNREWYWNNFLRIDKVIRGDKKEWE